MTFKQLSDVWEQLVSFESVTELWNNQPTYMLIQILFILGGLLTLCHAFTCGGRRPILWFSIILHGLVIECVCYALPDIDNFWHSRAPIMFFGQRLPLYVIVLYSVFYYIAIELAYQTNRIKVSLMVTVGLNVLLIDLPYDIIGIKFVHWTWHDTDPNLEDRLYFVPLTSYYFHMVFSASFVYWFFTKDVNLDAISTYKKEIFNSLKAIILSTPSGMLCFSVLYHPLHDLYNIPTQVIMMFLIALYTMFSTLKHNARNILDCPLILKNYLIVYYATFLCLAIWGKPENEISIGYHEEIGPCNITVSSFGTELKKRKYLCYEDYNEDFDFHCTKEIPKPFSKLYTLCGTEFQNRLEYIIILLTITIIAFTHFNKSLNIMKKTKKLK